MSYKINSNYYFTFAIILASLFGVRTSVDLDRKHFEDNNLIELYVKAIEQCHAYMSV
jgi:hypothetical protein